MLGQLENTGSRVVIADMEAGTGTLSRMPEGSLDLVLLVTEPSAKSIEVARRALATIEERKIGPSLVIANRVRDEADVELVRSGLGREGLREVPEDPAVMRAERDGAAVIDQAPGAAAVAAIRGLAADIASRAASAPFTG